MSPLRITRIALTLIALGVAAGPAVAQCVSTDFEEFAVGTAITTQVPEVTCYVVGQSCGGSPTLYLRSATTFYGDSFASRVLLIDTGCPDFSDDYLRLIFHDRQRDVRFTLGPWATQYQVRAYDTTTGGVPIDVQTISIPGSGFADVSFPVHVTSATRDIRRIEVEASASGHEAIDHLRFGDDSTPPEVRVDDPTPLECVSGEVTISGIVCDDNGAYDRDRLESMRIWPNPETAWTLVREYVGSPVCSSASLYAWDTTEPGIEDGVYALRVTAANACGLTDSELVTTYVDNDFDSLALHEPEGGAILGGTICLDGTAWDRTCFDHYVALYRPAAGGPWLPVDPNHATYTSPVTNEPAAHWRAAAGLPDGDYQLVLAGYTTTGASQSDQIAVTLDNTPPTAQLLAPEACEGLAGLVKLIGTVDDPHLDTWRLDYWSPTSLGWVPIGSGSTPVLANTLATWDTDLLPPCYYTVRLRAWDSSIRNLCGDISRNQRDVFLAVAVGDPCPGDVNGDGNVDLTDLATVLAMFGTICD